MSISRERALALMHEYTASEALRRHMYAVELAMAAMARRVGADEERWRIAGLLHDFDYERFPNADRSPEREHPAEGVRILRGEGVDEEICQAILGHAAYTGVARETPMAQSLFAVDELAGFVVACALVRPSRSLSDLEPKSVIKKLKDKGFARGVSRDDVRQGADEIGIELPDLVRIVIDALRPHESLLGLGPA